MEKSGKVLPWEGVVEGYTKKKALGILWRFKNVGYEMEDVIQEGWIVYAECCRRYGDKVVNEAHFMSLFKKLLHSRFIDLTSNKIPICEERESGSFEEPEKIKEPVCFESSMLRVLWSQAPAEIAQVLVVVRDTPSDLAKMLGLDIKRRRGFHNNKALCDYFGWDSKKVNIPKMMNEYFI